MSAEHAVLIGAVIAGLSLAGCGARESPLSLAHSVKVPERFMGGRGWAYAPSDHERYVIAYEEGWRACLEAYAKDIEFVSTDADKLAQGWAARVVGFQTGFEDAERRIELLKQKCGPEKTRAYLGEFLEGL